MKLFATARSGNSKLLLLNREEECIDWDESGGFHVTPKATCKSSNTTSRPGWRLAAPLSYRTPKSCATGATTPATRLSSGMKLFKRTPANKQHESSKKTGELPIVIVRQQRPRRSFVEQIPAETQIRVVYGDSSTIATSTTGRTSIKTEPDELTKRAMARVVLQQLLDHDERAKISQQQELEEPSIDGSLSDEDDSDDRRTHFEVESFGPQVESMIEEDLQAIDYWLSCCGECSEDGPLTPSTMGDQTLFTEGSSFATWLTDSFQSSSVLSTQSSW